MAYRFTLGPGRDVLRVAVVHGRDWAKDNERKIPTVDVAVQQALGPHGFGDRIERIDLQVVEYANVLDAARPRAKKASVQFPVVRRRPLVTPMSRHVWCSCCPELDRWDKAYSGMIKGVTWVNWLTEVIRDRLKDVRAYLSNPVARTAVMDTVRSRFVDFAPHVVVAHSLGSLVVLDVLSTLERPQPAALITIGSPVSVPVIRRQLPQAARGWMVSPQAAWLNVYDPTDLVTGCRPFEDLPPNQRVTAIANLAVNNDQGRIKDAVTHNLDAYLAHQPVARWLAYLADNPLVSAEQAQSELLAIIDGPVG
jgi:hypothetical protein